MRLLVLSTMFPSEKYPNSAIFLANFLLKLRPHLDDVRVISPRVYVPWVLTWRRRWARHRDVPGDRQWHGIEVIRPTFIQASLPFDSYIPLAGPVMERCIRSTVKKAFERKPFDAILGFYALPDGDAAVRLSKRLNVPAIVWCIGTDINDLAVRSKSTLKSTRRLLQGASLVITSSGSLAQRVTVICPEVSRVRPFYRGIDLDNFRVLASKEQTRAALGIPANATVLIYVGRLMREKGIRELVSAFRRLRFDKRPIYLILVGEDQMGAELRNLLSGYEFPQRIIETGIVSHSRVAYYLSAADILVCASYQEGLPNAVVEAMASGVAVVATNVGGIPEIVADQETGLLVPPKNSDGLFAAVSRMIEDHRLRERCVVNGRNLVFAKFDAEKNAMTFRLMLDEIVSTAGKHAKSELGTECIPTRN